MHQTLNKLPASVLIFLSITPFYIFKNIASDNELDRLLHVPESQTLFSILSSPILDNIPLPQSLIILRLLLFLAVAIGFSTLGKTLKFNKIKTWAAFILFLIFGQSLWVEEWVIKSAESKVLAYALTFFGIANGVKQRYIRSAIYLGAATSLHILVGLWTSLFMLIFTIIQARPSVKTVAQSLLAWLIFSSHGLKQVITTITSINANTQLSQAIYVYFRNPHHLDPNQFPYLSLQSLVTILVFWAVYRLKKKKPPEKQAIVTLFTIASTAFLLSLMISTTPIALPYLLSYPFRVPSIWIFCFGSFAIVSHFTKPLPYQKVFLPISIFIITIVSIGAAYTHLNYLREHPIGFPMLPKNTPQHSQLLDYYHFCQTLKNTLPKNTPLIVPPMLSQSVLWTQQPAFILFKNIPTTPKEILIWAEKLNDLNNGKPPKETGFNAAITFQKNYFSLNETSILKLLNKWQYTHIILAKRPTKTLRPLYESTYWGCYTLDNKIAPTTDEKNKNR